MQRHEMMVTCVDVSYWWLPPWLLAVFFLLFKLLVEANCYSTFIQCGIFYTHAVCIVFILPKFWNQLLGWSLHGEGKVAGAAQLLGFHTTLSGAHLSASPGPRWTRHGLFTEGDQGWVASPDDLSPQPASRSPQRRCLPLCDTWLWWPVSAASQPGDASAGTGILIFRHPPPLSSRHSPNPGMQLVCGHVSPVW